MNAMSFAPETTHEVWRTPSAAVKSTSGGSANFFGDKFIERGNGTIRQEHRAGLRIERLDVAHAVVLLVRAGEFVFLDDVA